MNFNGKIQNLIIIFSVFVSGHVMSLEQDIIINGRKEITVTTPQIRLSDLADVTTKTEGQEEAVIALKKIVLSNAPKPNEQSTLSASQILEKLNSAGVNLKTVGYVFPRVVTIKRAGRALEKNELQVIVNEILKKNTRDIAVKDLIYTKPIYVAPGEIQLVAEMFEANQASQLGFKFKAKNSITEDPIVFDIYAQIEEWQEVPIASKPIARGSVVQPEDVQMARYNISQLPRDVALKVENIYGLSVTQGINFGEVFRRNKLFIPPVIETGSNVTIVYRQGALEATAKGVALESGIEGADIKVRNDASKKIIVGRVLEPGLVGVNK